MLDRLASGGILTVIMISLLALGYNKVLVGPKWAVKTILLLGLAVIFGSQLLPDTAVLPVAIRGDLLFIVKASIWASPFVIYGLVIAFIRKKTREREADDGS